MTTHEPARLIDFHSHYYHASWTAGQSPQGPAVLARAWPLLTSIVAQLEAMDAAGIDAKVLSAPTASLVAQGEQLPIDTIKRINDHFAEQVAAHPTQLLALATIDAFQDDVAAREVERAIQTLHMGGICIDCAQGDRYLDAPETRVVLETAAVLGAVVFVHPVSPIGLTERLARLGHTGVLMARGTETAVSILAMLRQGIFDELPDLEVVIPMIGAASFLFAGLADQDYQREAEWRGGLPSATRQRLYVDTMGFDTASIRFAIELLGPEHVLLGSDWPIMPLTTRQQIEETLAPLDLTPAQQAVLLGGNTERLLHQKL